MKRSEVESILFRKSASAVLAPPEEEMDNGEPFTRPGIGGMLAATEKLLAVNRGLAPPDQRDNLQYKRILDTARMLRERVRLDNGKLRNRLMRAVSRQKSLKSAHAFMFDDYAQGQLIKNPLSAPLEEINPLQLMEQSRRMTLMGPGGIGSDQAITEQMQAIDPSQFGFISTLEGPECHSDDTLVMTEDGWHPWKGYATAKDPPRLLGMDPDNFRTSFEEPERVIAERYEGAMYEIHTKHVRLKVTPTHDIMHYVRGEGFRKDHAIDLYGKAILVPGVHVSCDPDALFHVRPDDWFRVWYTGNVFCATVAGGYLFTTRDPDKPGVWSGNSEKIGVDTRAAWGSKLGTDGKLYQRFTDRRSGKVRWMSPEDLDGLIVKLPD